LIFKNYILENEKAFRDRGSGFGYSLVPSFEQQVSNIP